MSDGLPDFVIIGAMRAGTTALADCLGRHPEIGISRLKETDFFIEEKNFGRGMNWYRSLFPENKRIVGEASPNYTKRDVFENVPARIHAANPDVKLIYVVRDPVKRFWSHYQHSVLVHGGLAPPRVILEDTEGAHILAASCYYWQLCAYLEFFDRAQIYILDFDAFTNERGASLQALCNFLGVSAFQLTDHAPQKNSSASLGAVPGWALKLAHHPGLVGVRSVLPGSLRNAAKTSLSKLSPSRRQAPVMPEGLHEQIGIALQEDATQFRKLTARAFPQWSV